MNVFSSQSALEEILREVVAESVTNDKISCFKNSKALTEKQNS